jgi:hypothetical protein
LGIGLLVWGMAAAYFLAYFDPDHYFSPMADVAWFVSVFGWLVAFWQSEPRAESRLVHPLWLYALYVAILLPFSTNWRWALTGDNMSWLESGLSTAELGLRKSLLSADGPDDFGELQANLHNLFMFIVKPTLFWHRAGKITVGVLALASVYAVFARIVAPRFGLLVAACAASCSVLIVYTYASVPFVDGIASGYAMLAVGMWVRRRPESRRAWLTLGLLSGFMLFLTPNGWLMALAVWTWLTVLVFWHRWPVTNLVLAMLTGLFTGIPMLLQWAHGNGSELFSMVRNPDWSIPKVLRFMGQAALMPFSSDMDNCGAFGPQLPWGFRWLFVPSILLTPLVARRFPGSRFVFCLYVLHVVVLAFTQGPYGSVSVKRSLILIPMATYFVFLPFHRYLRSLPVILGLVAVWASFGAYDLLARIQPGRTGYNLADGVIEAHQRFADADICIFLHDERRAMSFAPGGAVERLYQLSPRVHVVSNLNDAHAACRDVLCYCTNDGGDPIDLQALGYVEVPMLNTLELRCGDRRAVAGDR